VKAIIRAELKLNKKKKEQLFKADKENRDLAEKNKFLKNRTEFLEEENESLEDANKVLKDERDRLLPFERESHQLRQQNEQFEISKLIRKYKNIKFKEIVRSWLATIPLLPQTENLKTKLRDFKKV
jgi:hypothetical protein